MPDDPKKLAPIELFTQLEEDIDKAVARFREAAPLDPTQGNFTLNREAAHRLTARLISVTSKLHALELTTGNALAAVSAARAMVGDPITDDEIEQNTVRVRRVPSLAPDGAPAATDDVMRPAAPPPPPPAAKPPLAPNGKPWN